MATNGRGASPAATLKAVEPENQASRQASEILRKTSTYFPLADLTRS